MICPKHKVKLTDGLALKPFYTGIPDFTGHVCTVNLVYTGELMDCLKCPFCGYSVTEGSDCENI